MALIGWYPLNNSIQNQGIGDSTYNLAITNTLATPTLTSVGKVTPKCFATNITSSDNSKASNYHTGAFTPPNSNITIACWFKPTNASGGTQHVLQIGGGDYRGASGTNATPVGLGIRLSNLSLVINCNGLSYSVNRTLTVNTWYHCAITLNSNTYTMYLNGEAIYTIAKTNPFNSGSFVIGSLYASTYYTFYGLINDARYYDNCLSVKEIKELAKGLCLHYKLSRGGENLLVNSGNYQTIVQTNKNKDGYASYPIYFNGLSTSKTYTLSCECDGELFTHDTSGKDPGYRYWTIWLYQDSSAMSNSSYAHYATPTCFNKSNLTKKHGNIYEWSFKPSYANVSVRFNTYSDGTNNTTVTVKNIKLEEGSVATPWVPNKADAMYSALGYNNIEPDCSGYGNDGTINGTLTYSNDTPRYLGSSQFNGSSNFIKVPLGAAHPTDAITVSLWVNKVSSSDVRCISCTEGGGWNFEGSTIQVPMYINGGYRICVSTVTWASLVNGWHHLAFTYDGNTIRFYLDGTENKYYTYSSTKYPITYPNNCTIIGAEASGAGSSATGSGYYFDGKISDVRIYATALSATDIKSLYNESASLCDNYSFMVREVVEQ